MNEKRTFNSGIGVADLACNDTVGTSVQDTLDYIIGCPASSDDWRWTQSRYGCKCIVHNAFLV